MANDVPKALAFLDRAGSQTADAAKAKITGNIPPPLSPYTIANRWRGRGPKAARRANEEQYLNAVKAGMAPGEAQTAANLIALINTGKMLRAITYVVRKAK